MRNGKLATIIFIRDVNSRGHEVSGYIDYGHRLTTDPNVPLWFERKKRLMPKPSDLSYYNWVTHLSTSNPTPNFQVGGWDMRRRGVVACALSRQGPSTVSLWERRRGLVGSCATHLAMLSLPGRCATPMQGVYSMHEGIAPDLAARAQPYSNIHPEHTPPRGRGPSHCPSIPIPTHIPHVPLDSSNPSYLPLPLPCHLHTPLPPPGHCGRQAGPAVQEQARPQGFVCGPGQPPRGQQQPQRAGHGRIPAGGAVRPRHAAAQLGRAGSRWKGCWGMQHSIAPSRSGAWGGGGAGELLGLAGQAQLDVKLQDSCSKQM